MRPVPPMVVTARPKLFAPVVPRKIVPLTGLLAPSVNDPVGPNCIEVGPPEVEATQTAAQFPKSIGVSEVMPLGMVMEVFMGSCALLSVGTAPPCMAARI